MGIRTFDPARRGLTYQVVAYTSSLSDHEIDAWCQQCLRGEYYIGPVHNRGQDFRFVCDRDAMMFKLRWS